MSKLLLLLMSLGSGKDKIKAQLLRLEGMAAAKVKPELRGWINARIAMLKQM